MRDGNVAPGGKGFFYRVKRTLRLKISAKIFLYFLCIALIPLIAVSFDLVLVAHDQLTKDAGDKQKAVATDLSRRVDNYLAGDINQLTYQARLYSTDSFDLSHTEKTLATLFNQNAGLQQITLLTADGHQDMLALDSGKVTVTNTSLDLPNAKSIDYLANKPYFISVGRDGQNNPQATIAVPVLKSYDQPNDNLFSAPSGPATDIVGAIVAQYNVGDLWKSVLSVSIGNGGYAYVVDGQGNLVTHPDRKFLKTHRSLENTDAVHQFLGNDMNTDETVSETGVQVISTPGKTSTGWGVIVQEPESSIYAGINSYIQMAAAVGISAIILSILVGLFFSRQLVRPINELTLGAKRMGHGDFEQTINIHTHDELQDLADTFNGMAKGIKKLVGNMKTNNLRLKFEQMKLNNILSSVSDGIVAVNSSGEIISINPPAAKLVGQAPDVLEGKLVTDIFPWEHEGNLFTPDLQMGGIYHYTNLVLNRGDSIAYLELMVSVLKHQDSDVAAIITIHDQTESRELSFMKLDFVAIAAHELRTPLTVVRGYLDMLDSNTAEKLSIFQRENLEKAIVGAEQLRQLINKLLNIARIERGDMEIFIEKLDITKLVSENVEQHVAMAEQKGQTIAYDASTDETIYVPADTASIVEVLNNLIGNAIKYTPRGGKIKVNLIAGKKEVRVRVSDNGPGVPEELRDRLFTKFYRAERSLISGTRGTGLGMFISKTIIKLQNGTIGIEPDQGNGSTFYFTLPVYDSARDDELIAKKSSGGIRGWFKKRPTN